MRQVGEVEQELKDAIAKCASLEQKSSEQAPELTKALESVKEARVEAQGTRQKVQEARQISAGKAFLLKCKFTSKRYILLTRIWCSLGGFADLQRSVADAAEFFRAEEGSSREKLF